MTCLLYKSPFFCHLNFHTMFLNEREKNHQISLLPSIKTPIQYELKYTQKSTFMLHKCWNIFESRFQNKIEINQRCLQKMHAVLVFWGY